ncbi:MAG: hypC [Firmicutes bacterium]|nr:hypC [Bacillota bacterium]
MCLAVPARIIELEDMLSTVDISGVNRKVSMMLLPDAVVGDYVLVHAGFAIQKVDEAEAKQTMELLKELAGYDDKQ